MMPGPGLSADPQGQVMRHGHLPGHCPAGYSESECDGIQYYGEDPYLAEIQDIRTEFWMCTGEIAASSNEI